MAKQPENIEQAIERIAAPVKPLQPITTPKVPLTVSFMCPRCDRTHSGAYSDLVDEQIYDANEEYSTEINLFGKCLNCGLKVEFKR